MNKVALLSLSALLVLIATSCMSTILKVAGIQQIDHFDDEAYQSASQRLRGAYAGESISMAISDTSSVRYAALF